VLPVPLDALIDTFAASRKTPGSSLLDVCSSRLFPGCGPEAR
jgi:hypothetical protein